MKKELIALQYALAKLVPFREQQFQIATESGINTAFFSFSDAPVVVWFNIIRAAENANKLNQLIDVILKINSEFPEALAIKNNISTVEQPQIIKWNQAPKKSPIGLNSESDNFEKIMESQSTLLPISFLQKGVEKSKAVCRIKVNGEVGTGFLLKNNLLVTNNHVITNIDDAKKASTVIQFNYEESPTGGMLEPVEFKLSPDEYFKSSPKDQNDFTIVKVQGDANAKFGFLEFNLNYPKVGEFVNIVQHPAGEKKQIALYHNVVVYSDDNVLQYLTDTRPGSSGSPVLNSNWEVVGLHHAGGNITEPVSQKVFFRNEGINISKIAAVL